MGDGIRWLYVVQALHYAQYDCNPEGQEVEVLDENDMNIALVAVRETLEEARTAGAEYIASCSVIQDAEEITGYPLESVSVVKVAADGPPVSGEWLCEVPLSDEE